MSGSTRRELVTIGALGDDPNAPAPYADNPWYRLGQAIRRMLGLPTKPPPEASSGGVVVHAPLWTVPIVAVGVAAAAAGAIAYVHTRRRRRARRRRR